MNIACNPHLLQLHRLIHQPLCTQAKALLLPVQAVVDLLAGDVLHQVLYARKRRSGCEQCRRAAGGCERSRVAGWQVCTGLGRKHGIYCAALRRHRRYSNEQ